jgi:hypothetical protein
MLPLNTKVLAAPELGISIVESEQPPDPQHGPFASKLQSAFAVHIPRVPVDDPIEFQVVTADPDNKRAAGQTLRVYQEMREVLSAFHQYLLRAHPSDANRLFIEEVLSGQIKEGNFFAPAYCIYEKGRIPLDWFTEAERLASAHLQDLEKQHQKALTDMARKRPELQAPVVKIKTPDGVFAFPLMPPIIKTYADFEIPSNLPKDWTPVIPPIPKSY